MLDFGQEMSLSMNMGGANVHSFMDSRIGEEWYGENEKICINFSLCWEKEQLLI